MMAMNNTKLNAAGLTPDHSIILPAREANVDELAILEALTELYTGQIQSNTISVFSPHVVFTMPNGDVVVGPNAIEKKFSSNINSIKSNRIQQRLLRTPESLPARTMCIDQLINISEEDGEPSIRNLIVIKRRATDGLITSMTEEEGHRRATAPLAARAASGNNFYSPTDNMLSPCTSKLNLAKKRHHFKGKPTTLFASTLANSSPKVSKENQGLGDSSF
jgi:Spo12 family